MRPRADEVLTSVIATFDEYLKPELTSPFAKSLALTVKNLLNHVKLRIEREGPALFEDNRDLRALLSRIYDHLLIWEQTGESKGFKEIEVEIKGVLKQTFYGPLDYPTLVALTEEATALRWALTHAIQALQENRETLKEDATYRELRQRIRDYLSLQLKRESMWIDDAFQGDRR